MAIAWVERKVASSTPPGTPLPVWLPLCETSLAFSPLRPINVATCTAFP